MSDSFYAGGPSSYVPEAVVDALVEAAWAFPGLRVSYARMSGPRTVRHLASAGAEGLPDFTGSLLDLAGADALLEAFRTADQAIGIEDVTVDTRTRPIADLLVAQGTRSYLIWPVRRPRDPFPMGWIALDSDRPRTWGHQESESLENLGPLILMALDHAALSQALSAAHATVREHERRLGGQRGFAGSALHHSHALLQALMSLTRASLAADAQPQATALCDQLARAFAELSTLKDGTHGPVPAVVDLNAVVADAVPALTAQLGGRATVEASLDGKPLQVDGRRAGLERTLFNLLAHACASSTATGTVVLSTRRADERAELVIRGSGLAVDAALRQIAADGEMIAADRVALPLWRAHCELLLHDARLTASPEDADPELVVSFPLIAVRARASGPGES